jgi:cellobiose epimerase
MHHLEEYKNELIREVEDILSFWIRYSPDPVHGGFYGKIDNHNRVYPESPKGAVLNCRILWTFSAAFNRSHQSKYLVIANRAYEYIADHFIDREFGGVYWSLDHLGRPLSDRKQIYGLAFCIYGLSEYYKCVQKQAVLELAVQLFRQLEQYAFDPRRKGYYEAFSRDWKSPGDLRLSAKDVNEQKTTNTHLHILEAYTNLYTIWKNAGLRNQVEKLLEVFAHHIVDNKSYHLQLFFDEEWNNRSKLVSYGHDIEAAWLLQLAAETIRHPGWTMTMKSLATKIADAAAEGLDEDGGMKYESENGITDGDKHWWPQAEAMVGFFNAYEVSREEKYLKKSLRSWQFINQYIKDTRNGEWFWGVHTDRSLMEDEDKGGFWKCPYHNTRACLELIHRIAPELVIRD